MRDLKERIPRPQPKAEHFTERSRADNIDVRAQGASVVQVETLGRHGLFLLFLCAFLGALASIGFIFTLVELKTVSARYEVLQYDQQALKAQLVAKGVYEATEH